MELLKYIQEHTRVKIGRNPLHEIIVDDPDELLLVVIQNGYYISEIRWWDRTELELGGSLIGGGGPVDPASSDFFFAETDICKTFEADSDVEDYLKYFAEIGSRYSDRDLYDLWPAFGIAKKAIF